MSGGLFIYPPLKTQDSIRLLHIHQAQHIDEPLSVSLTQTHLSSLTDSPDNQHEQKYTALSYCWGSQENPQPVFIDQRILFIGQNLSDALRHMRKPDGDTVVWADGLCINQDDLEERSSQVKMMRNIYSAAAKTVVFLGLEGGNTSISAWNYLERESHAFDSEPGSRTGEEVQTQSTAGFRGGLQDIEIDVLTRPWFRRVWVLQEVVVSRNILVQCSQRRVFWDDFCKILLRQERVNDRYGFSLSKHHLYEYLLRMVSARSAFLRSRGQSHLLSPWYDEVREEESRSDGLLDMLFRARSLEASEPRDKIFAILGISSGIDVEIEASLIDYSLPVVNVYRNFAEYVIESSQSYDILSAVAVTLTDGLPSWVPDWGVGIGLPRTILSTFPSEDEDSIRARQRLVRNNHDWLVGGDTAGKSLVCVGRVIGKITEMTIPIRVHADEEWGFEKLRGRHKNDEKEVQKAILRKWEEYPWNRSDRQSPRNYLSDGAQVTSDRRDVLPTDFLGMGNRPHKRLEKIVAPPAISTTTEHEDNDYELEEFFPHIRSNTRTGFFPAGTFASPELSERNTPTEGNNNTNSFFSLHTLKSLFGKPHQINNPSTSKEFAITPGSIEAHLLQRSRKTVQWTENGDILARGHVTTDKTSIIDGRSFAKFIPMPLANPSFGHEQEFEEEEEEKECVALVTPSARPGDVIVQLRGGRVAYVVHSLEYTGGNELDGCKFAGKGMSGMRCRLVGECLVDKQLKFEGMDKGEDGFGGVGSGNETVFIFQEWDGVSDVEKLDQWSSF